MIDAKPNCTERKITRNKNVEINSGVAKRQGASEHGANAGAAPRCLMMCENWPISLRTRKPDYCTVLALVFINDELKQLTPA